MAYTIKNFLEENFVPGLTLLTRQDGASDRQICTAGIHEYPFKKPLEADELVLYRMQSWEDEEAMLMQLVQLAHKAKAAGLLVSGKEKNARLSAQIIRLAEACSLPLFQVPQSCSFSQLQSDLKEIVNRQIMADFEAVQQTLFHSFFESFPLEETGEVIACALRRPTRIIDSLGNLISDGLVHSEIPPKERTLYVPVEINGTKYAEVRLHLSGPADPFRGRIAELEKYVAFPLSLWFNRRNIEQVTQRRIRSDFVWNLARGNFDSSIEMREQGKYLGFNLSRPYVCIAMKASLRSDATSIPVYTEEAAGFAAGIEVLILQEAKRIRQAVMTARLNLDFVVFLEPAPGNPIEAAHEFLDRIEKLIAEQYPDAKCLWGISEPLSKEVDYATSFRQASQALAYCVTANDRTTRFTYHRTRKAAITAELSRSEEIQKGAAEVFSRLLAYDQSSQVDLLKTLTTFIATNYNASKTAQKLHLNRQSLLYRLSRIEQLTGMSLHDHDDLFVLEVFSRIYASY